MVPYQKNLSNPQHYWLFQIILILWTITLDNTWLRLWNSIEKESRDHFNNVNLDCISLLALKINNDMVRLTLWHISLHIVIIKKRLLSSIITVVLLWSSSNRHEYNFVEIIKPPHFTTTPHIVISIQVKCIRETIALWCRLVKSDYKSLCKERKIERKNSSSTVTLSTQWQWLQEQYQSYKVNIRQI